MDRPVLGVFRFVLCRPVATFSRVRESIQCASHRSLAYPRRHVALSVGDHDLRIGIQASASRISQDRSLGCIYLPIVVGPPPHRYHERSCWALSPEHASIYFQRCSFGRRPYTHEDRGTAQAAQCSFNSLRKDGKRNYGKVSAVKAMHGHTYYSKSSVQPIQGHG
jgi:hypothetical protein